MANVEMQYIIWGQKEVYYSWLREVKSNFRALESIRGLEGQVAEFRERKRMSGQRIDMDFYRRLKYQLQQRWMNYYEDKLVDKLEEAMREAAPNCLVVIALPEAVLCDYVTECEAELHGSRESGYVNPLYEETVRKFLGPSVYGGEAAERIISAEDGNKTLLQFTEAHGQVLLFAGTIWWKQWIGGYPKGVIFNSAPVFYQGKCCFMWDKQYISNLDGISRSKLKEQWCEYRINAMPMTGPVALPIPYPNNINELDAELDRYYASENWQNLGILSSLTARYNPAGTPLLEFVCQTGDRLLFGIDICKDNSGFIWDNSTGNIIVDLNGAENLDCYPLSLAEYFAKKASPVNVVMSDGRYSISTGEARKIDISIILANDLRGTYSSPKYHICKADACGQRAAKSCLITSQEEPLRGLDQNFFLVSNVVQTEPREE